MKFSPDACITCGTRLRVEFTSDYNHRNFVTDDRGTLCNTLFWFCSKRCIDTAIDSLLEKRFQGDREAYDDPNLPNHHIEEFFEKWQQQYLAALEHAVTTIRNRAIGESKALKEKLAQQQEAETIKQLEKDKREKERQEKETQQRARQQFWDGIRLQDRDRSIRLQDQREGDRKADRAKRLVESNELRAWREESRQWQLQERDRREQKQRERDQDQIERDKERAEEKAISQYDDTFKWAQADHQLHLDQQKFIPKPIPPSLRFEHVHILGPTGVGKSTIIKHIALKDFHDYGRDAAHIIIDPKRSLINDFARLKILNEEWRDRLVIVDPFDRPAFNIFALKTINVDQLVSNFAYIFSTVGQTLTAQQLNCFTYCASLLFKVPNANLTTFEDLLSDRTGKFPVSDQRFVDAIASLTAPDEQPLRRFFEKDYYQNYGATREQIKARLVAVGKEPNLAAMLNSKTCKLNVSDWIEQKKIVLIDTRMVSLPTTHHVLGRLIISLFQQAILDRTSSHPAFIFIDEFQQFADEFKTPEMLRLIREFNGGALLAHQNMNRAELDRNTQNAISTNTIIKFASNPGGDDIGIAARDLRCSPEFLTRSCVKAQDNSVMRFGCFFTGLDHPFVYEVGHDIKKYPRISDDEYRQLRAENKAALADEPEMHEAPQSKASPEGSPMPSADDRPMPPSVTEPSSRPAPDEPSLNQGRATTPMQTASDPSASARWGQSKK